MFTTLDLKQGAVSRTTSREDGSVPTSRPRRSVVRRACDWCKLMRIKCDSHRPCSNCQQANRECGMTGDKQFRSIAEAVKEIDTLRAQVREFESTKKQLEETKSGSCSPIDLSRTASLSESYTGRASASRNGVRVDSVLYGVASLPFFLTRMRHFVHTTRRQTQIDLDISVCAGGARSPPELPQDRLHRNYLSPAQEAHFLDLFWQSHYFSYPILHEAQFRKEYKALIDESNPEAPRKPSPLVDIVLALCIQLGSFHLRHTGDSPPDANMPAEFPSLAGFQYYQRCQEAIDRTIDNPSMDIVKCYIFSIVYLWEAGLLNRAQIVTGKAIMTSMMLGLHNEPPSTESEPHKEVARRTWWSLYILDAKLSMEIGQPPMIGPSHPTCQLPTDSPEIAQWLAPHYPYDEACPTWLGFQTQTLRLLDAVRTARSVFCTKYDTVVDRNGYDNFASDGNAREECARALTDQMKELDAWTQQVPEGYYVVRKDDGQPYSTDRTQIDLNPGRNVLIHCQRQRLVLELQYHQYCMSLYQPFICFVSSSEVPTPLSDSKAAACLDHAIALTSMIHQGLTSSRALSGIYDVFRWQKNALFTILGFAYTFPVSHSTVEIRKAIEMAIAVLDMYRDTLPEASSVAAIARVLAGDVGAVITNFYAISSWTSPPFTPVTARTPTDQTTAPVMTATTMRPLSSEALGNEDLPMMMAPVPLPTDEPIDLQFMPEANAMVEANWGAIDELWASLDHSDGSRTESWPSMGDLAVGWPS
ncbi:fungal-specific transcription factor domain-containing protein [Xylariaceae sp. FL1651]|nr:fungal-specific transcription factor domain-containing protein [Xylariaceae sp. FL1651]